jgi:HK97 gp10 family phage protein
MARGARKNAFKVTVEGAKELDNWLGDMGDQCADIVYKATAAGGDIILDHAKTAAPEGETGRLKRNITMGPVKPRKSKSGKVATDRASVQIGFNRTKKGAADDAYYGVFVELGTKFQKARFFLRDSIDKTKQAVANRMISEFKRLKG